MKILLVWTKARTDPDWGGDLGAIAEPLALEYLAAGLLQENHIVNILDLRLHPESLQETLASFRPDLIGVTAFSMHVSAALSVMKLAKQLLPCSTTIVGGHHATILPEDFFEPQVDFIVCGEGVRPLKQIVKNIENKKNNENVPGVWYNDGNGKFINNYPPPPFQVDDLPFPDREITGEDRKRYFIDWMAPVALLRTSVGCPYRCTFCSLWKIMDGRYYKRNIARVVEEVKLIKEDFVFLIDDEAFIDGPRMLEMAIAFQNNNIYKRFFAYCRIDTIIRQKEVLKEWKKIGLERLFVGIDAISSKDLSDYNKRLSISQIETGISIAEQLGIEIFAQFVINTDYTETDFNQMVRFIEHHKLDYPTFTILTPLPGTNLLSNDFSNISVKQPNGRPDWDYFDTQSVVMPTRLSAERFRKLYRQLFKIFSGSYSSFLIHKPAQTEKLTRI